MLNLVKYDFRKISVLFYSLFAVTIVSHLALLLLGNYYQWWDEFTLGAGVAVTSTLLQIVVIILVYNFNTTLKSVTRRLLPISALKEYASHLVVPVAISMLFLIEGILFAIVLQPQFRIEEMNSFIAQLNGGVVLLGLLLFFAMSSLLNFVFLFFAVAVTRLFRTNGRIAIFIGITFVCSIVYSIISDVFINDINVVNQGNIRVIVDEAGELTINVLTLNWKLLVDMVLLGLMYYVSVYIMKNKLEA